MNSKPEPIVRKNVKKKEKTSPGGLRAYYHYAFPVLVAIFIFFLFTQYIFNQIRQTNKTERLQIEQLKRLNEARLKKSHLIDEVISNNLDDKIIINSFRNRFSQEEQPFSQEIKLVEDLIDRNEYKLAIQQLKPLMKVIPTSHRCLYASAFLIDRISEFEKNNYKLIQSIEIYKKLFSLGDLHKSLIYVAGRRLINRLQFVGKFQEAISYGEYINRIISSNLNIINDLGISYLMSNKLKQAKEKFEQVLTLDNNNTIAICHYAFILKTFDNRLEESVIYFKNCLQSKEKEAMDARFFYHLGDSLQRLNRTEEAYHYYEIGVKNGFFNSVYQRSLYNEPNLRAKPIWNVNETGYETFFKILEDNWQTIKHEALAQINQKTKTFMQEDETLINRGDWKHFNLYLRGKKLVDNCQKVPYTCQILDQIEPAFSCSRGQIKLSLLSPDAHVWPHCGLTNSRLRTHLGLVVPYGCCKIRVANETLEWEEGKLLIFDDSFEHEVWHNGTSDRLVLIVDFWHPDIEATKWSQLNPI